jgi:hypothetical protein
VNGVVHLPIQAGFAVDPLGPHGPSGSHAIKSIAAFAYDFRFPLGPLCCTVSELAHLARSQIWAGAPVNRGARFWACLAKRALPKLTTLCLR